MLALKKRIFWNKKGWTLLEMMVTLGVFAILGLLLMTIFLAGETLVEIGSEKLSLQQEARSSIDRMLKELRQAQPSTITVNAQGNNITFQIPQTVDSNTGEITWSSQITYSIGGINNVQLLRTQVGSASQIVLANHVNNNAGDPNRLQFQLDQVGNPSQITINMGLANTLLKGQTVNIFVTGEVNLRNTS